MPGSGKTISVQSLKEDRGAKIFTMGDRVREKVVETGKDITPETLGAMAKQLRSERGPDAIAILTIEAIERDVKDGDLIIIDGIRSMHEVALFRTRWSMPVVAIHSPPRVRHQRLSQRGRSDDHATEEYLKMRDERELGFGIGNVIALADAIIVNSASTTEAGLREAAAAIITGLEREVQEGNT